jgi:hypothetical protein
MKAHESLQWLQDLANHEYATAHSTLHQLGMMETRCAQRRRTLLRFGELIEGFWVLIKVTFV